jgi:S-adenosylmethionine hydrolase
MSIITLLTDFGTADSYVAEMKAVLLSEVPGIVLIDVTHDIPSGNVLAAQYVLSRVWRRFPLGTVHLAVVDPGVGTVRRALAGEIAGHQFVAPDNGLLSGLPATTRFVALPIPALASPTFHGRDVFAPIAALLATGGSLESLGAPITDPVRSPLPVPHVEPDRVTGEVIYIDHFGNLISNVAGVGAPAGSVTVAGVDVGPLRRSFGEVATGELIAYVGSAGTVEIAQRDGSAAGRLGAGVGADVRVGAR